MQICYPTSNSTCPAQYTVWGTYDTSNPASNGTAVMTNVNNSNDIISAENFQFRSDGIWIAQFAGLTAGCTYHVDASYVSNGTTIAAPQVTNVLVSDDVVIPVPPPPEGA
ncbi:MAG: hypothetical protein NZU63_09285 [Gemmataceae bacterium]|nr:hypothetical protein [Gemmataceae bacterium]MDW8242846.1 hypothetical protein [Thermogemmata sp.]